MHGWHLRIPPPGERATRRTQHALHCTSCAAALAGNKPVFGGVGLRLSRRVAKVSCQVAHLDVCQTWQSFKLRLRQLGFCLLQSVAFGTSELGDDPTTLSPLLCSSFSSPTPEAIAPRDLCGGLWTELHRL